MRNKIYHNFTFGLFIFVALNKNPNLNHKLNQSIKKQKHFFNLKQNYGTQCIYLL